jgi:hypothetical protein
MDPTDWFLEIDGAKTGPYSVSQVEEIVRQGRVPPDARATADWLCGEWVSVSDLLASHRAALGAGETQPAPSGAPAPRETAAAATVPPEAEPGPSGNSAGTDGGIDPTFALFEVFQAARETKAHGRASEGPTSLPPPQPSAVDRLFEALSQISPAHWARIGAFALAATAGTLTFLRPESSTSRGAAPGGANEASARKDPGGAPDRALGVTSTPEELARELALERERSRKKELEREQERERDREREKQRERELAQQRERERQLAQEKDRDRDRERDRELELEREREQERERELASDTAAFVDSLEQNQPVAPPAPPGVTSFSSPEAPPIRPRGPLRGPDAIPGHPAFQAGHSAPEENPGDPPQFSPENPEGEALPPDEGEITQ